MLYDTTDLHFLREARDQLHRVEEAQTVGAGWLQASGRVKGRPGQLLLLHWCMLAGGHGGRAQRADRLVMASGHTLGPATWPGGGVWSASCCRLPS